MSIRIAVDVGFGYIKVLTEKGQKERFPSVIAKRSENTLRGIVGGSGDDYAITYWEISPDEDISNEKKLFVGDAAMNNGGTRKWEDKTDFNSEELKVFISTAVGLVNSNNEDVDLCVGLPMSYYAQKKDELIEILKSLTARVTISNATHIKEIKFSSVFCFPQGAGAYYASVFDINGEIEDYELANSSVGVIDIGYRTVDYLVMGKGRKGISIVDNLSGSLEENGMNVAFQRIEKIISNEKQREIGLLDVEKAILWFGGKLSYRKEEINLENYETTIYKELADEISSKIRLKWGTEADMLSAIICTGGGSESLFEYLENKFETATYQEDSAFSNCKGYLGAQARKMKK